MQMNQHPVQSANTSNSLGTTTEAYFDSKIKSIEASILTLTEDSVLRSLEECRERIAEVALTNPELVAGLKDRLFSRVHRCRIDLIQEIYKSIKTIQGETLSQSLLLYRTINLFLRIHLPYFNRWRDMFHSFVQTVLNSTMMPHVIMKDYYREGVIMAQTIMEKAGKLFPYYFLFKEMRISSTYYHPSIEFHKLLEPIFKRIKVLNVLLNPNGIANTARWIGNSFHLNQDLYIGSYGNMFTELPPFLTNNKNLKNRLSVVLQHILTQGCAVEAISTFLVTNIRSTSLKSRTVHLITEAMVDKTIQLLNKYYEITHPQPTGANRVGGVSDMNSTVGGTGNMDSGQLGVQQQHGQQQTQRQLEHEQLMAQQKQLPFIQTQAWKEWSNFSDQFFCMSEAQLIDYEQYVLSLAERKMKSGQPIQDSLVVLVLSKAAVLNEVKNVMSVDVKRPNDNNIGFLLPAVLSLCDESQYNDQRLNVFNHSIIIYIMRTHSLLQNNAIFEAQFKKHFDRFKSIKAWWDTEKLRLLELANNFEDLINISVWSTFTTTEIQSEWSKVQTTSNPNQKEYFPLSGEVFGRTKAFPPMFLPNLTLRCRKIMILDTFKIFYEKDHVIPPGLFEDFSALIHLTHHSINHLLSYFAREQLKIPHLYSILELVINRLFRVLKNYRDYSVACRTLTSPDFEKAFANVKNLQFARSVDFFSLKLSLYANVDILKESIGPKVYFGQVTSSRRMIPSIAKLIKIKGIMEYSRLQNISTILESFHKLQPTFQFSKNTIEYFPDIIKIEFSKKYSATPPPYTPILQKVQLENGQKSQQFRTISQNPQLVPQLLKTFNEASYPLFLPQCLLLIMDGAFDVHSLAVIVQSFAYQFSESTFLQYCSTFVDFVVNEVIAFYSNQQPLEAVIKKVSDILTLWMYGKYKVFSQHAFLILLSDRDDSSYSFAILQHLMTSNEVKQRLDHFISINKRDEDYFKLNAQFNITYNDLIPTILDQPVQGQEVLPIYCSNSVLRLLPVVDILIAKAIESSQYNLFKTILNTYRILYLNYHDEPIAQVRDTLIYYFEAPFWTAQLPDFNPIIDLIQLIPIAPHMTHCNIPALITNPSMVLERVDDRRQYFSDLLDPLTTMMDLNHPNIAMDSIFFSLENNIYEFPNPVEERFNLILIELLANGLDAPETIRCLFEYLSISGPDQDESMGIPSLPKVFIPPPAAKILVVGTIIAQMPVGHQSAFHQALVSHYKREFSKSSTNPVKSSYSINHQQVFCNYSTNYAEKMVLLIQVLMHLTQTYFNFCPLEKLQTMTTLINELNGSVTTFHQFLCILASTSPNIPRYASTTCLCKFVTEVLNLLHRLDARAEFVLSRSTEFNPTKDLFDDDLDDNASDPMNVDRNEDELYWDQETIKLDLSLVDTVTDWLYHIALVFKNYIPLFEILVKSTSNLNPKWSSKLQFLKDLKDMK